MMDAKTKARIEKVVAEAVAMAEGGSDEFEAARQALTAQTTDVYRELAVATLVGMIRRKRRAEVLNVERSAESEPAQESAPILSPGGGGFPKGSRRYWEWVQSTPEGKRYQEEEERFESLKWGAITAAINDFAHNLRMEWTQELLSQEFALTDGSRVTWGDATIEQHRERADLFARNAAANAEGAARHQLAVEELERAGCPTLGDLVGRAA